MSTGNEAGGIDNYSSTMRGIGGCRVWAGAGIVSSGDLATRLGQDAACDALRKISR